MSDQCHFCPSCGHIRECEGTDCDIHENWYAQTLKNALQDRERMVDSLKEVRLVVNMDPTLHHLREEPWWGRIDALLRELEAKS